jgi:hypothetical protein
MADVEWLMMNEKGLGGGRKNSNDEQTFLDNTEPAAGIEVESPEWCASHHEDL